MEGCEIAEGAGRWGGGRRVKKIEGEMDRCEGEVEEGKDGWSKE